MNTLENLVKEFKDRATNYHKFGLAGDYKRGNAEINKITKIYESIKKNGGMDKLLDLVYSGIPEVASLTAAYCMRFNPEVCLGILNDLIEKDIPLISFEAKYTIQNWLEGKWYID